MPGNLAYDLYRRRVALIEVRTSSEAKKLVNMPNPHIRVGRCSRLSCISASHILAAAAKRLPGDWERRYAYESLMLKTFVERNRFRGTCYHAANWLHVGETQGPGKLDLSGGQTDRQHRRSLPIKHVYVYPLHKHFRQELRATPGP